MKSVIYKIMSGSFLAVMLLMAACKANKSNQQETQAKVQASFYTCSMHPQIIRDAPGDCPICGMRLVKKVVDEGAKVDVDLNTLLKATNRFVVSSIPVVTPQKGEEKIDITALGVVAYDTREVATISARISGRIDKLYIHYRFQAIQKGQKIMEIYSPELVTAQQNLLFLLANDPTNNSLTASAKEKLLLIGMDARQVEEVIKTRKPAYTISVYSTVSGHIHEAGSSAMNAQSAGTMKDIAKITEELPLKEGMYVQKGETIFTVYNPDKVWALLNIYADDQALIKVGNKVAIIAETAPDKPFDATISFIEPFFRSNTKTITARAGFNNASNHISVGSQVKAVITGNSKDAWWLPATSIVTLGIGDVVFVKEIGGFKAKKISTGMRYKDKVQVLNGISDKDTLAANAQFLMDSESFIKLKD